MKKHERTKATTTADTRRANRQKSEERIPDLITVPNPGTVKRELLSDGCTHMSSYQLTTHRLLYPWRDRLVQQLRDSAERPAKKCRPCNVVHASRPGQRHYYRVVNAFPRDRELRATPQHWYKQSEKYNPVAGGAKRYFAPIEDSIVNNEFLKHLIFFDLSLVPFDEDVYDRSVQVGLHVIHMIATPTQSGMSVPEYPHQDGEPFTFIHLVERKGVSGGETRVFKAQEKQKKGKAVYVPGDELLRLTLDEPFETLAVNDKKVFHQVTNVTVEEGKPKGSRLVLLVDFTPLHPDIHD